MSRSYKAKDILARELVKHNKLHVGVMINANIALIVYMPLISMDSDLVALKAIFVFEVPSKPF
ncbi:hypothetical protein [Helicobacter gastrocanis]|uniref:hypothetical protein n=1 Tax=Helicobacter gastrocanis TaxID=2849641 RepID=UPI001C864F93|nr:hypothetical protein [Helicobacter sp. NHP19-003]